MKSRLWASGRRAVQGCPAAIALGWDDVIMILAPDGEVIEGNGKALTARSTECVHCRRAGPSDAPATLVDELAAPAEPVDAATWSRLAVFAQRTLPPTNESSRLSGAGAGLSDNN